MKRKGIRWWLCLMGAAVCIQPARVHAAQEDVWNLKPTVGQGKYSYVTPFAVEHSYITENRKQTAPRLLRLTSKDGEPGVAVYCGAADMEISEEDRYRRANLEEADGYSDDIAARIRSVLLHSYPQEDLQALERKANGWLRQKELPEIRELQSGEALLAAQIALWKLTAGRDYTVHNLYSGILDVSSLEKQAVSRSELKQRPTAYTPGNVESLYIYLYNLPPTQPEKRIISDRSISRTVCCWEKTSEGSFQAEIIITADIAVEDRDDLILTAEYAGQRKEKKLTQAGEYCFTFEGAAEPGVVEISITGDQYGEGAFLYLAKDSGKLLFGCEKTVRPVFCRRLLVPVLSEEFGEIIG